MVKVRSRHLGRSLLYKWDQLYIEILGASVQYRDWALIPRKGGRLDGEGLCLKLECGQDKWFLAALDINAVTTLGLDGRNLGLKPLLETISQSGVSPRYICYTSRLYEVNTKRLVSITYMAHHMAYMKKAVLNIFETWVMLEKSGRVFTII